jgi:ribose 5-phosphate isomerase B
VSQKDNVRSVALGCDHGAFSQKETLKRYLETVGYRVVDVGCRAMEKVDYPDIAVAVCRRVVSGDCERGIVMDGAGIGSCMAANKIKGIRAALCYDIRTVINSREHNNANVLSLGGPLHDAGQLCDMAKTWLETRFGAGRHMVRVNKIMAIERSNAPADAGTGGGFEA